MEILIHEVIDETLEYEERQYGATWWIRTKLVVIGQLVDHVTEGLELLKRYMDGFNDQGVKYPAKAPTAIRIQTECDPDDPEDSRFILYQYLGDETCTQPPIPGDSMVTVEKWPPFGAYVRPFEGFTQDEDFISEARNIIAFLSEFHVTGYYHDDHYFLAGFDNTDILWSQKNEIWIIKED